MPRTTGTIETTEQGRAVQAHRKRTRRTCDWCGQTWLGYGRGRYCSLRCKGKAQRARDRHKRLLAARGCPDSHGTEAEDG